MVAMYDAVRAHVDGVWGLPTQEVHAEERKFIAWTPRYRDYFEPLGAPLIPEWRLTEGVQVSDALDAEADEASTKEEIEKVHERKEVCVQPKAEMKPRGMGKGKGYVKSRAEATEPENEDAQKVRERDEAVAKATGKGKGHVTSKAEVNEEVVCESKAAVNSKAEGLPIIQVVQGEDTLTSKEVVVMQNPKRKGKQRRKTPWFILE